MNKTALILTTLLIASLSDARAQLLFDNGVGSSVPFSDAYYADAGYVYNMAGNVFTPTASGTATQVVFDGAYAENPQTPPTDSFTLSLYSTSGGAPDTLIGTSTVSNVTTSVVGSLGEYPIYEYSGTIDTPFTLSTASSYYLGFTDTDNPVDDFALATSGSYGPATSEFSYSDGFDQSEAPDSAAFELTAAVPEPSSYAFGLIVLGVLAFEIRRRATQSAVTSLVQV